jgi:hypothetical protein
MPSSCRCPIHAYEVSQLERFYAHPAGGGADVGDRRVHGVLPKVVGLPVGDFLEQVRFGPAVDGRRGQHRVLELAKLAELLDAGLATRKEFEQLKAKILQA